MKGNNIYKGILTLPLKLDSLSTVASSTHSLNTMTRMCHLKAMKSENSLVIAWLINSMEPTIGKPHLFLPTAKDVWEAVRDLYIDLENSSQIFELKMRLWKARNDRDVTIYYTKLVTL
ncbi:hypothetical protein CR513_20919, partial [Mucuna pruriens]